MAGDLYRFWSRYADLAGSLAPLRSRACCQNSGAAKECPSPRLAGPLVALVDVDCPYGQQLWLLLPGHLAADLSSPGPRAFDRRDDLAGDARIHGAGGGSDPVRTVVRPLDAVRAVGGQLPALD